MVFRSEGLYYGVASYITELLLGEGNEFTGKSGLYYIIWDESMNVLVFCQW